MHTGRVTLAVPDLVSGSVLKQLKSETPARVARLDFGGGAPVEAAPVSELAYFPMLHLQVWRERIVPEEANTDPDALRELQVSSRQGRIIAHALFPDVERCGEEVCVLSNISSHNSYHYLEELYKVVVLERAGFRGKYVFSAFPSRFSQDLPRFSGEFLELLGVTGDRIMHVGRPMLFRAAWFTTRITHPGTLTYSNVFFDLRNRLLSAAAPGRALGPRLWHERAETPLLVNAEAVHERLGKSGFTVVNLAELSASERVAAAAHADVLGGQHDPALILSMFMKPGSAVIECFSPRHIELHLGAVLHNLRHRYFQLVQENTGRAPYRYDREVEVNCDHLKLVLGSLDR